MRYPQYPQAQMQGQPQTAQYPQAQVPGQPQTAQYPQSQTQGQPQMAQYPQAQVPGQPQVAQYPQAQVPGQPQTAQYPQAQVPGQPQMAQYPQSQTQGQPQKGYPPQQAQYPQYYAQRPAPYGAPAGYARPRQARRGDEAKPIRVFHDHSRLGDANYFEPPCGALLLVEGGNLTFTPTGGEAPLVIPAAEIVEIRMNTAVGKEVGAFHIITRKGLYLHLAPEGATSDMRGARMSMSCASNSDWSSNTTRERNSYDQERSFTALPAFCRDARRLYTPNNLRSATTWTSDSGHRGCPAR